MSTESGVLGASFRDPAGFVFRRDGVVHRQVNHAGAEDYDALVGSGLYGWLVEHGLLVPHDEVKGPLCEAAPGLHHKTLLPEQIGFVSYPYEWCFSQLREAALLTLRIQRRALRAGLSLKDASAYNVQFQRGRPVFIDTLSFERYREGEPWVAYRQFCQHFLAPLALMSLRDLRLSGLLRESIDGIPLDLAVSLLPARAWLRAGLVMHLRLHARYQRSAAAGARAKEAGLSRSGFENLVGSLESVVKKLRYEPGASTWGDYYEEGDSYGPAAFESKRSLVGGMLASIDPRSVWDLGANTGAMSRVAAAAGAQVVAFDVDPVCVERCYLEVRAKGEESLLPLVLDLANPSPALGWANEERATIAGRGRPDAVLALAIVHHLAIANNVPLPSVARFLAGLSDALVIEFVPKDDPKVETLLASRRDVFADYTVEGFESAFRSVFEIVEREPIEGSRRILYRMRILAGS